MLLCILCFSYGSGCEISGLGVDFVRMSVAAVDMFPWASGVETVVLLGREFSGDVKYAYLDYEPRKSV